MRNKTTPIDHKTTVVSPQKYPHKINRIDGSRSNDFLSEHGAINEGRFGNKRASEQGL